MVNTGLLVAVVREGEEDMDIPMLWTNKPITSPGDFQGPMVDPVDQRLLS
jgi:uncharacterized protein YcsI (UPF0317 family)